MLAVPSSASHALQHGSHALAPSAGYPLSGLQQCGVSGISAGRATDSAE